MQITDEQASQVIKKFEELFGKDHPCSMCGGVNWEINDTIFELRLRGRSQVVRY